MKKKIADINDYIGSFTPDTKKFFLKLHKIIEDNGLVHSIKWGIPSYSYRDKNYIALAQFKNHAAIWFTYGFLLEDAENLLVNSQKDKTKYQRNWKIPEPEKFAQFEQFDRFVKELIAKFPQIENIKNSKSSISKQPVVIPILKESIELNGAKNGWDSLTYKAQEDYNNYINEAKQLKTQKSRIERIIPLIKDGKSIRNLY